MALISRGVARCQQMVFTLSLFCNILKRFFEYICLRGKGKLFPLVHFACCAFAGLHMFIYRCASVQKNITRSTCGTAGPLSGPIIFVAADKQRVQGQRNAGECLPPPHGATAHFLVRTGQTFCSYNFCHLFFCVYPSDGEGVHNLAGQTSAYLTKYWVSHLTTLSLSTVSTRPISLSVLLLIPRTGFPVYPTVKQPAASSVSR